MPKLQLIAVKMEGKTVESFKLADITNPVRTDNGLVDKSQPFRTDWFDPTVVADIVLNKKADIVGIHSNGLFLEGSNGSFNRYANLKVVEQGKKYPLTVFERVNINGVDGCTVIDVDGRILTVSMDKLVKYAEAVGISNGKVVEHNSTKFISSIRGEYPRVGVVAAYEKNVGPVEQEGEVQLFKGLKRGGENEQGYWPEGAKLKDEKLNLTVEEKLIVCYKAIQNWNFFIYSILSQLVLIPLRPEAMPMPTMGVDTRMTMIYNPYFVLELPLEQLIVILLHETYHILFSHPARIAEMKLMSQRKGTKTGLPFKQEAYMYNIAADLFVNKYIADQFACTIDRLTRFPHTVVNTDPFVTNTSVKKWTRGVKQIQFPEGLITNDKVDCEKDTIETLFKDLIEEQRREMEKQRQEREQQKQKSDPAEDFDDMPDTDGESGVPSQGGQGTDSDPSETDSELDKSNEGLPKEGNEAETEEEQSGGSSGEQSDEKDGQSGKGDDTDTQSGEQSGTSEETEETDTSGSQSGSKEQSGQDDTDTNKEAGGSSIGEDFDDEYDDAYDEGGGSGSGASDDEDEDAGSDFGDSTQGSSSGTGQRPGSYGSSTSGPGGQAEGNFDEQYSEEEDADGDSLEDYYSQLTPRTMNDRREEIAGKLQEYKDKIDKIGTDLDTTGENSDETDTNKNEYQMTPEEYQAEADALKNWKEKLKSTVLKAEVASQSRGLSLSAAERRLVDSIIKPIPINWKILLKRMFNMAVQKANSFKKPSRRPEIGKDVILPGKTKKDPDGLQKIIFAIDTSGSVGDMELKYVLGTIRALTDKYKVDVEIVWWSTNVNGTVPIKDTKDLLEAYRNVASDGGTCATNLFKYIADKQGPYRGRQIHGLIIFTDGFIEDVPLQYKQTAKNILWMIHSRPVNSFTAPFGTVAYIEVDD